jgi:hypothetical protein
MEQLRTLDLREAGAATVSLLGRGTHGRLTNQALEQVLAHRDRTFDALLILLRDGLRIGTPRPYGPLGQRVAETLREALEDHPRSRSLSELPASELLSRPAEALNDPFALAGAWRRLHRVTSIAALEWVSYSSGSWPSPEFQWGAVADIAAITRALCVVDADLGRTVRNRNARRYAVYSLLIEHSRLPWAARRAFEQAVRGPTADGWQLPPPSHEDIVPAGLENLHRAARSLAFDLHRGRLDLSLSDALDIIRCHATACLTLGSRLEKDQPAHGETLKAHGRALLDAATHAHGDMQALAPSSDLRPVAQARKILETVRDIPLDGAGSAAAAYAQHTPAISHGITDQVISRIVGGHWITPDEHASELRWRTTNARDLSPTATTLVQACADVQHLGPSEPFTPTSDPALALPAHHILPSPDEAPRSAGARPHRPGRLGDLPEPRVRHDLPGL